MSPHGITSSLRLWRGSLCQRSPRIQVDVLLTTRSRFFLRCSCPIRSEASASAQGTDSTSRSRPQTRSTHRLAPLFQNGLPRGWRHFVTYILRSCDLTPRGFTRQCPRRRSKRRWTHRSSDHHGVSRDKESLPPCTDKGWFLYTLVSSASQDTCLAQTIA